MRRRLLFVSFLFYWVFSMAQKKDTVRNYLGEDVTLPTGQFSFCGKKNGESVSISRIKSDGLIRLFPELESREILKVKVAIHPKDSAAETIELTSLFLSDEIRNKMIRLNSGSQIKIQIQSKNKSTQIKNISKEHIFIVSGK
jgi:hypothetical protein